ncbi:MAG: site-2 protease family protein [Planctomycetota bacterium]
MDIKIRKDLQYFPRSSEDPGSCIIKDPVRGKHFLFDEREMALIRILDDSVDLDDAINRWNQRFATRSLTQVAANRFLNRLLADQLLVVDRLGYGKLIQQSHQLSVWSQIIRNPLAIKFPVIRPARILILLTSIGRVLFYPPVIMLNLGLACITLLLLLGNFELVFKRLPELNQLTHPSNLILVLGLIAVVKIVHELGHALAAKQFGCECNEIGIMLLVMMPTLYTDVSDSWTISDRRNRILVSFAGIYVELMIATIAVIGWFATPPGLAHLTCLNLAMLCSINSLLVNGNPLLKYDGYFILSDLVRVPNLQIKSQIQLSNAWQKICGEAKPEKLSFGLLAYGVLSSTYRIMMLGFILTTILLISAQWQILIPGFILVAWILSSVFVGKFMQLSRTNSKKHAAEKKLPTFWSRKGIICVLVWAFIVGAILIPIPRWVACDFSAEFKNPTHFFCPVDGTLADLALDDQFVDKETTIARIQNFELEHRRSQKQIELEREFAKLHRLRFRIHESQNITTKIELCQHRIGSLKAELLETDQQLASLTPQTSTTGILFSSYHHPTGNHSWSTARQFSRHGEKIDRGKTILSLGDPKKIEFIAVLSAWHETSVEIGQKVTLKFDRLPERLFEGKICEILPSDRSRDADSTEALNDATFRLIISATVAQGAAIHNATGRARIHLPARSIGKTLYNGVQFAMENRL